MVFAMMGQQSAAKQEAAQQQQEEVVRLQCAVQQYEWGRIGEGSEVGRLHALGSGAEVDKAAPYAELWMGTHPSGPSLVVLPQSHQMIPLKDWLQQHPQALGHQVLRRWEGDLPYLFKVLSVAKALSIQAHPDKKLAERLHRTQPKVYKDGNHKPEMALALSEFGALCGFVSSQELKRAFETVPELAEVVGEEVAAEVSSKPGCQAVLQRAFTQLMTRDQGMVSAAVTRLIQRLTAKLSKAGGRLSGKEELLLMLEKQYPGDVGVLSALFLNYVTLSPGQAVFLDANEPHAYLFGDCIECMAASDNVVRAGLTPKLRDTDTLCSMLTYKQGLPELIDGVDVGCFTRRYSPPSEEFEVDHMSVPAGETVKLCAPCGPSIFLVYAGVGVLSRAGDSSNIVAALARGNVFLLPAGAQLELSALAKQQQQQQSADSALQLFRAGVSSRLLLNE